MLTTEQYPITNHNWEDRAKENKTWADWEISYKKAQSKARVNTQTTEGSEKFGAANAAKRFLTTSAVETNNVGEEVGMKAFKGYFDKLVAAAINEKSVLQQLVVNNSKLATTNEDLVAMVKNCPTILRIPKEKPPDSRKQVVAGHHKERGTQPCTHTVKRKGIMNVLHALKSRRTRTSACPVGKAGCDSVGFSARLSLVNLQ